MKSLHVAILAALWAGQSFAGNAPPLFSEVFSASQPTPPRAEAAFPVTINFPPINANPETLELQLPGSEAGSYTATRVRFEDRGAGAYNWIGKTSDHDVVLSVDGDLITGFIRGTDGTYSVLSGVDGGNTSHVLMRMDVDAFPSDVVEGPNGTFSSEGPTVGEGGTVGAKGATANFPEEQCFGSNAEPIDLLVVYSPESLAAAGGNLAVLQNQLAVAEAGANTTLGNSNVPVSVNIVAVEPAPFELVELRTPVDLENARDNLELQARRRFHKADITVYLTSAGMNGPLQYCGVTRTQRRAGDVFWGIGYDFYDSAVLVLTHQCGIQNNDLSHEIGHNVGLDHNPAFAVGNQNTNLYQFSFGHEVNTQFRDDMSGTKTSICQQGCPRMMWFSDPATFTNGFARGTNSRNNAETYRRMFRCTNTLGAYIFVDNFE